jgi:hypothetical protein
VTAALIGRHRSPFPAQATGGAWLTVKRALTRFGDIEPCDDRLPAFDHPLSGRGRKPDFDQIPQLGPGQSD